MPTTNRPAVSLRRCVRTTLATPVVGIRPAVACPRRAGALGVVFVVLFVLLPLGGVVGPVRTAGADVVVLTSGARVEGRVVSEDATSVVVEQNVGGGTVRATFQRTQVVRIERGAPVGGPPSLSRPSRDEWWLLRSGERTVGTRHLLVLPREERGVAGLRLEDRLVFLAQGAEPGAHVDRIEDVGLDFRPTALHYAEHGDPGRGRPLYETVCAGPVVGSTWKATLRTPGGTTTRDVVLPAGSRGALGLVEAAVRATPRPLGLVEMPMIDLARGEARTVRAGFTALDVGSSDRGAGALPSASGRARIDVFRIEDGDRVLESRWTPGDPPRCVLEEVAPGVVAVPATREQAAAVVGEAPDSSTPAVDPLDPFARLSAPEPADTTPKTLTLPDVGFSVTLPGAAWKAEVVPQQGDEVGRRVVATVVDRLDAADVRIEWDPQGGGSDAATAERELFARLRSVSPDLQRFGVRTDVAGLPLAWRLAAVGTLRGERGCRTWILVADRPAPAGRAGRLTILATCPAASFAGTAGAVERMLSSFRWL